MKSKFLNSLILAALVVPGVAMAADVETIPASAHTVTSNVALVSNYLYRGISQTGGKAALQGGFDYAHASGVYAGLWGSNISTLGDVGVTAASLELDTYAGFKSGFAEDFSYDLGFLRYNYPGTYAPGATKADTNEIYVALGWKWITLKHSHSLGDTFGINEASGTNYNELNASYSLADVGVTLGAHFGKQTYEGVNAGSGASSLTYTDYKLSASKDFSGYVIGLAYSDTDATAAYTVLNKELGKATAVLSVSRAF